MKKVTKWFLDFKRRQACTIGIWKLFNLKPQLCTQKNSKKTQNDKTLTPASPNTFPLAENQLVMQKIKQIKRLNFNFQQI